MSERQIKKLQCKEEDQIDRLKSSFGLGNKGRLQKRKKKSLSKARRKLREKWYKRFGYEYKG